MMRIDEIPGQAQGGNQRSQDYLSGNRPSRLSNVSSILVNNKRQLNTLEVQGLSQPQLQTLDITGKHLQNQRA
jgi:hypothetical protein